MITNIIESQEIILSDAQLKMIKSGWGDDAVEKSTVMKIVYLSDGLQVEGYIALPKIHSETNAKFPCIIWNRGGAEKRGSIDSFQARGVFGQMAAWGYVVLASNYRGAIEGNEEFGGAELNDILSLIAIAEKLPQVDNDNWGIEGWSRGGMMMFLTLMKDSRFKCAITSAPISNIVKLYSESPRIRELVSNLIPTDNLTHELSNRNIITQTPKLPKDIHYLIMHGTCDDIIPVNDSIKLVEKLLAEDFNLKLILFDGDDHFLKANKNNVDQERKQWYDKFLKTRN